MGADPLDSGAEQPASNVAQSHWTGLSASGLRLAWILLGAIFVVDVLIQFVTVSQGGREALGSSRSLLGMWDLAKAMAIGTALIYTAGRVIWRPIAVLGVLFLVVGIEDQIAIHGELGRTIADSLRFDSWIPGIGRYAAVSLGEFIAMALFGFIAFLLVWAGRRPPTRQLSRARGTLTLLLAAMFFFAGFIDLLTAASSSQTTMLIEELGERAVLSLSAVYALSLVWSYPGGE